MISCIMYHVSRAYHTSHPRHAGTTYKLPLPRERDTDQAWQLATWHPPILELPWPPRDLFSFLIIINFTPSHSKLIAPCCKNRYQGPDKPSSVLSIQDEQEVEHEMVCSDPTCLHFETRLTPPQCQTDGVTALTG